MLCLLRIFKFKKLIKKTRMYNFDWSLKETQFSKSKGKVFSCFACGGGSTMGYKLSGYDVLGCNEIDYRMMDLYIKNHNPKYSFLEPIQEFANRDSFPKELYDLSIFDGSPPCSSFSMAGNRELDWGKKKKFREGQSEQVLDDLFFHFIKLAKKLQPKIIVAENVKGLLLGNAKKYVAEIYKQLKDAGYHTNHYLLNAKDMQVPQRRERVFFISVRQDLVDTCLKQVNFFDKELNINLDFQHQEINFGKISDDCDTSVKDNTIASELWEKTKQGQSFSTVHPKGHYFGDNRASKDLVLPTVIADVGHGSWHYNIKRMLNDNELIKASTFPKDYDFGNQKVKYVVGMSVPPIMMAHIADAIYRDLLCKIQPKTDHQLHQ